MPMQKKIILEGRQINYSLERKRVKNLNLRIKSDGTVSLSAPPAVPMAFIEQFLRANARKILSAVDRAGESRGCTLEKAEALPLFGQLYPVYPEKGRKNSARMENGKIILSLKEPADPESRKKTLESFYKAHCAERMEEICSGIYPAFAAMGVPRPGLKYRRMRSRWGSCMPGRKSVTFNTLLAMSPVECMEFVAVHEFCHFLHPDHSSRFYACLERLMPDWKARKAKLKEYSKWL